MCVMYKDVGPKAVASLIGARSLTEYCKPGCIVTATCSFSQPNLPSAETLLASHQLINVAL